MVKEKCREGHAGLGDWRGGAECIGALLCKSVGVEDVVGVECTEEFMFIHM